MTYEKAKETFDENCQLIGESSKDPLTWNLSAGLIALTNAIQMNMYDLRNQIQRLEQQVQNLRR